MHRRTFIEALAVGLLAAPLAVIAQQPAKVWRIGYLSYGPDISDLSARAAVYVDKILRGANPGELAVQQPTTFKLAINMKTAKALGLTIPQSLLLRADEVIR